MHGLHARAAVAVAGRRNAQRLRGQHLVREQHVGRLPAVAVRRGEPLRKGLGGDGRRHRAEIFAVLQVVEPSLHLGRDRRGQDRASAQRPRAPFHAPLKPAQDAVVGQQLRGARGQRGVVGQCLVGQSRPAQQRLDVCVGPFGTEVGVTHLPAPLRQRPAVARCAGRGRGRGGCRDRGRGRGRACDIRQAHRAAHVRHRLPAALARVHPQRRTQGGAGVASGGLHPHGLERAFVAQARVHDAVQRHAAGHGQRVFARDLAQPAGDRQHRALQHLLQRCGQVQVGLQQRRAGLARRPCQRLEINVVDAELPAALHQHAVGQGLAPARPAHRGQRHDLVLIARMQEPEVRGHALVEQPQRVRHRDLAQGLVAVVAVDAVSGGGALAAAVESEHGAALEGRGQEGAGLVAEVVVQVLPLPVRPPLRAARCAAAVQRLAQVVRCTVGQLPGRIQQVGQEQRVPGAVPGRKIGRAQQFRRQRQRQAAGLGDGQVGAAFGKAPGVEAVGHVVHVGQRQAGLLQARGDGVEGQLPGREGQRPLGVLDAGEALFLDRRQRQAVHHQRGSAVVKRGVDTERDHDG